MKEKESNWVIGKEVQRSRKTKCHQSLVQILDTMVEVINVCKCMIPAPQIQSKLSEQQNRIEISKAAKKLTRVQVQCGKKPAHVEIEAALLAGGRGKQKLERLREIDKESKK